MQRAEEALDQAPGIARTMKEPSAGLEATKSLSIHDKSKTRKHPHLHWSPPMSLLPYHAQRPDLPEAGACDVPYYYFTMPTGQTCWRPGLVMYLITNVPTG